MTYNEILNRLNDLDFTEEDDDCVNFTLLDILGELKESEEDFWED